MFDLLHAVLRSLRRFCRDLDPDRLTGAEATAAIKLLSSIERLAAGARLRLVRRIDGGHREQADWLAQATGQSPGDAAKDVETSEQLSGLNSTDAAVRDGELSPTQVREVASAAAEDPSAESDLLDTARNASVPELRRRAKRVRAAATDDAEKERRAHRDRDLASGSDVETGGCWMHVKGPSAAIAQVLAFLEPFIRAEFDKARREGRHERRGAYGFDALLAAMKLASARRKGNLNGPTAVGETPVGAPVNVLARIDVTALRRGHTIAGEMCEIDGVGPVSVEALRELLPQAAIDVIVTDGIDVFNVTHFGRRATARQHVVLDWLGGECARLGCGATRNLQIDHRVDWARIKITELRNLDWLCAPDHRRKTHQDWALVHGRGRRRMVPPDDPAHPKHAHDPPQAEPEAA